MNYLPPKFCMNVSRLVVMPRSQHLSNNNMLKLFEDRYNLSTLKFHLDNSIDEQYWAKDVLSKYVSSKFNGRHGNLIMIGPKRCGKQKMIETISNFVHVPLLVIDDAHELQTECKFEHNILAKLLRLASYDIEKASVGIVLFRNVNHYPISTQESIAKLMREDDKSLKIARVPNVPLPKEVIEKSFSFRTVMLIGFIDCDVEGKIARRYAMDLKQRKFNRSNAFDFNDLMRLNVCQELAFQFDLIAPVHGKFDQVLQTPSCKC